MSLFKLFSACLSLSMNADRIQLLGLHTQIYMQCMLKISIRMVVAIAMLTTHTDTVAYIAGRDCQRQGNYCVQTCLRLSFFRWRQRDRCGADLCIQTPPLLLATGISTEPITSRLECAGATHDNNITRKK